MNSQDMIWCKVLSFCIQKKDLENWFLYKTGLGSLELEVEYDYDYAFETGSDRYLCNNDIIDFLL